MPNAKKYQSIKNDPKRYEHYKRQKRKSVDKYRRRSIFRMLSTKLYSNFGVKINPFDLWKIAKRQRLICPLSGRKLNRSTISLDHKMPLSKGGTHNLDNLQFVHVNVNYAKNSLTDDEFLLLCEDVVKHAQK